MTDALSALTGNTAHYAGGAMIKERFYDIITQGKKKETAETGEEVAVDIMRRAGLEIV